MLLKDNLRNFWCYMQVEAWFFLEVRIIIRTFATDKNNIIQ